MEGGAADRSDGFLILPGFFASLIQERRRAVLTR